MPEIVTTPISYFEIVIGYADPNIQLWLDRAAVVQAIFKSLQPWNIKVDDVEVISTGKPSEQGIKFKVPEKRSSFFFGAASCKFTRDDTDWSLAEETIEILDAALSTLISKTGVTIGTQKTTIALHMQPKALRFIDILQPLIPRPLAALESKPVKTMATVVVWDRRKVTIDGSGQIANGIFLRFEREFDGQASYRDIAAQLKADEDSLFDLLNVKEER